MNLRSRLRNSPTMLRLGAASLVLACLSRWFLHPVGSLSQDLIDGVTGALYGVAIAGMLVSLRLRDRGCPSDAQ